MPVHDDTWLNTFSCMISHSSRTGGAECGPVVAYLLDQIGQAYKIKNTPEQGKG